MDIEKLIEDHQEYLYKGDAAKRLLVSDFRGKISLTKSLAGATILNSYILLNAKHLNLEAITFYNTSLYNSDFSGANLSRAKLIGSDLFSANFTGADLSFADLSGSDLRGADFTNTKLYKTKFRDNCTNQRTKFGNMEGVDCPMKCPQEGNFVGWKICRDKVIVKLLITGKRSSATSSKCRASSVKVLEVFGGEFGVSLWDSTVEYHVGDFLVVPDYEEDRWVECAPGIHFFITRQEAENFHW